MIFIKKNKYVLIIITIIIVSVLFAFLILNKSKNNYVKIQNSDSIPIPIMNWANYQSSFGFSFMYPTNLNVEASDTTMKVGGILINIEKLNCNNPAPKKMIGGDTTLYGFPAQIDEPNKTAYICNNTKTACLNIEKNSSYKEIFNTKITEGFFHLFISSLNITKDFDKISCIK